MASTKDVCEEFLDEEDEIWCEEDEIWCEDEEEECEGIEGIEYLDDDAEEVSRALFFCEDDEGFPDFLIHEANDEDDEEVEMDMDMDNEENVPCDSPLEPNFFKATKDGTIWKKSPVLLSKRAPSHNTIKGPVSKVMLPQGTSSLLFLLSQPILTFFLYFFRCKSY